MEEVSSSVLGLWEWRMWFTGITQRLLTDRRAALRPPDDFSAEMCSLAV